MNESRTLPTFGRAATGLASIAPARSRTDPPTPPKQERGHLSKRLHSNTITSRSGHGSGHHPRQRHRDKAKDTVQSAIELKPPISFDNLLRRDKKNADSSRQENNTQQQQQQQQPESADQQAEQQAQAEREARQRATLEDVEKVKAENEKREEGLLRSLKHVEELGMSSTRQLDDTYYAILEKASILRATVASLQQLAEESRRMHEQFKEDTEALQQDTKTHIDSFGGFEEQEKNVDALVARLRESKTQTQKLNERLEAARDRVEAFEKREDARQSKRMRRWHATWGTLVGVLVLLLAIVVLKHHRGVARALDDVGKTLASAGVIADEHIAVGWKAAPSPSEDPYLGKLFDEL